MSKTFKEVVLCNSMRVLPLFMAKVSLQTKVVPLKSCHDCIYFEQINHPFTTKLSQCRRFGERDENGLITYEYADLCRKNKHKCGPDGNYFEPK